MKCKRKMTAIVMAAAMMMTMVPTAYAAETTVSNETVDSQSLVQVNGVYQISTAQDLIDFATLVNSNGETNADAVLTNDINLNGATFMPIGGNAYEGSVSRAYRGTFDGQNFTISNATIASAYNMGIFGFVQDGIIKNLKVDYITVSNSQTENEAASAAVIGSIYQGEVTNVTAGENCSVTGVNRVGGVIGSARDEAVVTSCKNYADVTGSGMYTGGVIGAAHDMDVSLFSGVHPATVTSCYNYGEINGNSETGGIIGYSDQATVTDCHNEGPVTGSGNYGTGGIIGFDAYNPRLGGLYSPSKGSTVDSCTNSGAVNGPRSAGIVGTLGVTPGQNQPNSNRTLTRMSNCTNSGDITGTDGKCGAIFGYPITYAHGDGETYINHLYVQISNCTNTGNVNGSTPSSLAASPYIAS